MLRWAHLTSGAHFLPVLVAPGRPRYEFPDNPTGASFSLTSCPFRKPLGGVANNAAHSNGFHGMHLYPQYQPQVSQLACWTPVARRPSLSMNILSHTRTHTHRPNTVCFTCVHCHHCSVWACTGQPLRLCHRRHPPATNDVQLHQLEEWGAGRLMSQRRSCAPRGVCVPLGCPMHSTTHVQRRGRVLGRQHRLF